MCTIYENIRTLCDEKGIKPGRMCTDIGISKSILTGLKNGTKKNIQTDTALKIADYFGVSVARVLGEEQTVSAALDIAYRSIYKKSETNIDVDVDPALEEAYEVADLYLKLDDHGKGAVKAILNYESAAIMAEERQSADPDQPAFRAKKRSDGFVEYRVYDQPAAAGFGNYLDDPAYHIEQYPANIVPNGTEFCIKISGNSMAPDIRDGSTVFVCNRGSILPGQIGIFVLNGEAYCKKLVVDLEMGQVKLVSVNPDYPDRIIEECDDLRTVGLVLGSYSV